MFPDPEIIALIRDLGLVGRNMHAHAYCLAETLDSEERARMDCEVRAFSQRNRCRKLEKVSNVYSSNCHQLSLPFES